MKRALFILAFCLELSRGSFAAAPSFDSANKLYFEGKFAEAASAYQTLLTNAPRSPTLYFNLGNAFFKQRRIGQAIACYRQAEDLAPRDPDIRANLEFARRQVEGVTLKTGGWLELLKRLTVNEWAGIAAVSFWTFFMLLAARQIRPKLSRPLRVPIVAAGAVASALIALTTLVWQSERSERIAVVAVPEATVRTGPFDTARNVMVLHDGAELRVLDEKNDWLQVSAGERTSGWVPREAVAAARL
ncbi:MAG TPA: tetratricopeptide repeat protein [Verrucomicrobiae bacterium]|nr:tetratricopeptide repeat protein [Verrucomicrobiae bacterium]